MDPASEKPLAPARSGVQHSAKNLLGDLCSHPPVTTFGDFPFVGSFPGPWLPSTTIITKLILLDFPEGPTIKKIQSRSKFSISIEILNLARKFQSRRLKFPTKNRAAVGGGSLENFILARNFQCRSKSRIFLILGPSGLGEMRKGPPFHVSRSYTEIQLQNKSCQKWMVAKLQLGYRWPSTGVKKASP